MSSLKTKLARRLTATAFDAGRFGIGELLANHRITAGKVSDLVTLSTDLLSEYFQAINKMKQEISNGHCKIK
jgi:hypothetical protein